MTWPPPCPCCAPRRGAQPHQPPPVPAEPVSVTLGCPQAGGVPRCPPPLPRAHPRGHFGVRGRFGSSLPLGLSPPHLPRAPKPSAGSSTQKGAIVTQGGAIVTQKGPPSLLLVAMRAAGGLGGARRSFGVLATGSGPATSPPPGLWGPPVPRDRAGFGQRVLPVPGVVPQPRCRGEGRRGLAAGAAPKCPPWRGDGAAGMGSKAWGGKGGFWCFLFFFLLPAWFFYCRCVAVPCRGRAAAPSRL